MAQEQWAAVDSYIEKLFLAPDFVLQAALDSSKAAGLPTINVSPAQGKLLHLLARIQGARKILELGTLGGYSTIWLARALPPEGRLISLEIDPKPQRLLAPILRVRNLPMPLKYGWAVQQTHWKNCWRRAAGRLT